MTYLFIHFNALLDFWINTSWYIALLMSASVNISVFVITALTLDKVTQHLTAEWACGHYIDTRQLKPHQKKYEFIFGISSCCIFAVGSLFTRILYAMSAPIFMSIHPLSLGIALTLHIIGMIFTITIHSNFSFTSNRFILSRLSRYAHYHRFHHSLGNVNFGFVNRLWDSLFRTQAKK